MAVMGVARTAVLAAAAVPLTVFEVARAVPRAADALVRLADPDGPLARLSALAEAAPALERIDASLSGASGSLDKLSAAVPSLEAIAAATDDLNDLARSAALLPLLSGQAQMIGDQATAVTEWLERFAPVLERLVDTVGTLESTVGVLGDTLGPIQETTERLNRVVDRLPRGRRRSEPAPA
jgi:hypothetical protein